MTTPDTAAIRAKAKMWHLPAGIADDILALCDALDKLRAESERLQTIIGNLHTVEEKHRGTANTHFHRANRLQAENERLRAALEPFASEADMWGDLVPDDHAPLCVEMGHTDGRYYGSAAKYTVGDLRLARAALAQKRDRP